MVYVDSLRKWGKWNATGGSCHMFADTEEELHAFAEKIELKRCWFQKHRLLDHYDLNKKKRDLAVANGAKEVTIQEMAKFFKSEKNDNIS